MVYLKEILAILLAPSLLFNLYLYFDRKKLKLWEAQRDLIIKRAELKRLERDKYRPTAQALLGLRQDKSEADLELEKDKLEAEILYLEKLSTYKWPFQKVRHKKEVYDK